MEFLPQQRQSAKNRESAQESPSAAAALHVRLWTYGSADGKLNSLAWDRDKAVAEVVQNTIGEAQGAVIERQQNTFISHFSDPLQALSTAKSLQLKLLAMHREPPADQIVAAIIVCQARDERVGVNGNGATNGESPISYMPQETNSAQILVSEAIYESARNVHGFDFNSKPVREAADGGAMYELRWTDESTYGHLRKTSQTAAVEVPRERRYRIDGELGRGCMGVVYKAYDQVIGRPVALKTIAVSRSFPNREVLIERLKQEAKAAGSLDHPNIITIYDVGQEDDLVYLSMQLIEGKTLSALLAEGSFPPLPELLSYVDQICSAVGYAHQRGVIHRDLKPANFMLTNQGTIKILDFGIAKIEDATLTQAGMVVGTPTYMAPEQARAQKIDQRSDIFSLGSVFYEMFTREKPFKGDITTVLYKLIHEDPVPACVINPALPGGVDAIIRKALEKSPARRFQSCEEMREAFRKQAALLQSSVSMQAAPRAMAAKAEERPVTVEDLLAEVQPRKAHRWLWMAPAVCMLLAMAGTVTWAFHVKAKTGSFPPLVEKVMAMIHAQSENSGGSQQASWRPPASTPDSNQTSASDSSSNQQPATEQATAPQTSAEDSHGAAPQAAPVEQPATATTEPNTDASTNPPPAVTEPAAADSNSDAQAAEVNPFEPRKKSQKPVSATARDSGVKVEGFTRRDVPDLLNRADAAAGRGDYSLARYEYKIILRLDPRNAGARTGLRRVLAAEQDQARH